jgi:signal transduction histidine kinase
MDYIAMKALLSGSEMLISANELWLRQGDEYLLYQENIWNPLLKELQIQASLYNGKGNCFVKSGNICWELENHSDLLLHVMIGLAVFNVALILGWAVTRWNSKRKEMKSRMLVLQILTHELRTPIASLFLTVEGFRREFENLPESVYDEFRRLCEDSRRLRQLAEASKDYTQITSRCRIQSFIFCFSSRKRTQQNDLSFPSSLTMKWDRIWAPKAEFNWLSYCVTDS